LQHILCFAGTLTSSGRLVLFKTPLVGGGGI